MSYFFKAFVKAAVLLSSLACGFCQAPADPAPTAQPIAASQAPAGDKFQALHELSETARIAFEQTDKENMAEVERLLKSGRCQINRIGGLLDRTLDKLNEWSEPTLKYWERWGEAEEIRVGDQQKRAATLELDRDRAKTDITTETEAREDLMRRRANLEKYGKRTKEVVAQMDALVQDIRDSETRLNDAKVKFDEVSIKVANLTGIISAELATIRENKMFITSTVYKYKGDYESMRLHAQEICNTKKPVSRRTASAKH